MKAIVVTDQAAGMAGVKLVERPEPQPATAIFSLGFSGVRGLGGRPCRQIP